MPIMRAEAITTGLYETEPCIFFAASELTDDTLIFCLRALEGTAVREPDEPLNDVIQSGMVLAAESWRRGLLNAPTE